MKKTFRILGLALVVTGLLFSGCKKTEDEEEEEDLALEVEVSQTASKMTLLYEQFTGNRVTKGALGHKYANEVCEALGDKAIVINYHIYGNNYADAYTTDFCSTINSQFNVDNGRYNLPTVMFNRRDFRGLEGKIALDLDEDQNTYMNAAEFIVEEDAVANVAASAVIDRETRELTVHAKVYYTANGKGSTNRLNVLLIQNNVMGEQTGAEDNPAQVVGTQYRHMSMFRDYLYKKDYWGEPISPVKAGTTIDKTYTYNIPASYTDTRNNNSEPAVLEDLEVVVYVSEYRGNVINACKAKITIL
ncbi:MAG: Omp28-related outer membrane protein [Bacteroidales bacterium]|nr:Omp28-related outer membrane protein [Bacteroidales bacterium]